MLKRHDTDANLKKKKNEILEITIFTFSTLEKVVSVYVQVWLFNFKSFVKYPNVNMFP